MSLSSSVADATDCTLVEASSEADVTLTASSCERTAVVVKVRADASSSVEADETVSTISPMADSNSYREVDHVGLALLRDGPILPDLGFGLVLRLLFRTDLERFDGCAISPISSRRPRPGSTISKLPLASSIMAPRIADRGPDIERPMKEAGSQHDRRDQHDRDHDSALDGFTLRRVRPFASDRIVLTDVETALMTGSIAAKDSDIVFNSAASVRAVAIHDEKSRWISRQASA